MAVWIVQDSRIDFHFQNAICCARFHVCEVRMRHLRGCTLLSLITCEVRQDCYVFAVLEGCSLLCAFCQARSGYYLKDMLYIPSEDVYSCLDFQTHHQLCCLRDHHTMATENMGPLQRNEAHYIFNNNRLLIGWFERENQKNEAWLGKALSPDGILQGTGWRFYTSATSLEHTPVNKFHPALQAHFAEGNTAGLFSRRILDQLRFLKGWHEDVVKGRAKYSEHEGGELKTMTNGEMLPRHKVSNAPQGQGPEGGQKRKRDADGPEAPAKDKKAKLHAGYYDDNNEDDDEELPLHVKTEATEVDAMDQIPTVLESTVPDLQQHQPAQNQPQDQISASIASLGLTDNVVPGVSKPANQKQTIQGVAKPDPMALTDTARTFKKALLGHIDEWALYTNTLKLALTESAGKLLLASETGEILAASRDVLRCIGGYCGHIGNMRLHQEQNLINVRANIMPVDIVHAHEYLVKKYQEKERELYVVIQEMKQQAEAIFKLHRACRE
jgi:hypothetical protein